VKLSVGEKRGWSQELSLPMDTGERRGASAAMIWDMGMESAVSLLILQRKK